jgi:hypothetical protein
MDKKLCVTDPEEIFNARDDGVDLGDVIIDGLGDVILRAAREFGTRSVLVCVPGGPDVEIERPQEDPLVSFEDRIDAIVKDCIGICDATGAPYEYMAPRVFAIDGWSWNENVFRSPIWMNDHRDIGIEEARKINGLKWLKGSSLGIRFEPSSG